MTDALQRTQGPPHDAAKDEAGASDRKWPDLATLYAQYWTELVSYVRRSFGAGPPEPEDMAQAAFTHYAALAHPQAVDNPRAFLYRSARNLALDERRRKLVRTRAADSGALDSAEATDELDGERVLIGRERLQILDAAMRSLAPRQRDALILHRFHELNYVEIARQMRISQTQAKRLVGQAILACERALRRADPDSSDCSRQG